MVFVPGEGDRVLDIQELIAVSMGDGEEDDTASIGVRGVCDRLSDQADCTCSRIIGDDPDRIGLADEGELTLKGVRTATRSEL